MRYTNAAHQPFTTPTPMANGNIGIPKLWTYEGSPVSVSTNIIDPEAGDLVFDVTNDVIYLKTSAKGSNSGYSKVVTEGASNTLTNKTLTAPTITSPVITGPITGGTRVLQALFTENATSTTHTATFTVPAGSLLVDIWAVPQVLWTGGTASLSIGDAGSATGYFNAFDLKATDLVLGERLQASNANNWGGKNGTYLTTAGRFGLQATNCIGGYCITDYPILAVVTVGTPATTAGRLRVYVEYMVGETVAPVLA